MKFLIDADLPRSLIEIFRKYGYEAFDVRDVLGGVPDEEVYNYANKNNMVLVTRDLGFGDMYMVRGGYGVL